MRFDEPFPCPLPQGDQAAMVMADQTDQAFFVCSIAKLHCLFRQDPEALQIQTDSQLDIAVCQSLVPLVNIKIAGKWMFIPLKMVLTGIDPYPYVSNADGSPAE